MLRPTLIIAMAIAFGATAGAAVADTTAANTIRVCVDKSSGVMRQVRTGAKCKPRERGLRLLAYPGASGPKGDPGAQGPAGQAGPVGPAGSPDTPQNILDKLRQVDGTGSFLDADLLDGLQSSSLQRRGQSTVCPAGQVATALSESGDLTCAADARAPTGPAGGALTGSYPNPGLAPSAAIINQSSTIQTASMYINGTIRTTGLLQLGRFTSGGYPLYNSGVIVRRYVASYPSSGTLVAQMTNARLERDGTYGGLRLVTSTGSGLIVITCTGVLQNGAPFGRYLTANANQTVTVIDNATTQWARFDCMAGGPVGYGAHGIEVDLSVQRFSVNSEWEGFLISGVDQ